MAQPLPGRPAVFVDRDGCLIEEMGYLNHPSRVRILPRTAAAISRLNASGVPVLTSAVTGGAEAVRDGVSGAVIASHTAEDITRGLAALRDHDAARLAQAARAAAEPFTYEAQVDTLEKIYRLLVDGRASAA